MVKTPIWVMAALVTFSTSSFAQTGTPAEAKEMLTKAVAAVKADKTHALAMFNAGEGGFLKGDLYVFCADLSNGQFVAVGNPNAKALLGTDQRNLKDSKGTNIGQLFYTAEKQATGGQFAEVGPYMFPKPGPDKTPVKKMAYVTQVEGLGCGVGYYPAQ